MKKVFILLIIIGAGILFVSLYWSRISASEPPEPIKMVQKKVNETEVGKKVVDVLGVQDTNEMQGGDKKNNFGDLVLKQAQNVASGIEESATGFMMSQSGKGIVELIKKLPPEQQKEIQTGYCSK